MYKRQLLGASSAFIESTLAQLYKVHGHNSVSYTHLDVYKRQKQSLGRLSALCGCVVAATGSSCGITYLMGGTYEQITFAVQNMIANLDVYKRQF